MKNNFYFRYCGLYLIPYIGLSLAVMAIAALTSWQPPSVLNIIITMVSGYYPAYQFVKDHSRAPTGSEKRRFALATLVLITVLSTVVVAGYAAFVSGPDQIKMMMSQLGGGVFAGIIIVTMLVYFGVIWLGFVLGAKMQIKAIEKQRAKGVS